MIVTENTAGAATEKFDRDVESIRPFHAGPLRRCSRCGRKVFLPCLACGVEREGRIPDPFDEPEGEPEILHLQLNGGERQRYEYFHLKKVAEAVRREDRGETASFS